MEKNVQELALHERFEIKALDILNSAKILDGLLFGGGTMLRLCHGMNRYSVDMDFYFAKRQNYKAFHKKILNYLAKYYEITDCAIKYYTLLYEFRSKDYPRRLKIEIRKQPRPFKYEQAIAFSPHSTKQVLLKTLTLEQMAQNKIDALLNRREIRDCFDIEFLLRKGVAIKADKTVIKKIKAKIESFKKRDFKTILGPLLISKDREYYIKNGFKFLLSHL